MSTYVIDESKKIGLRGDNVYLLGMTIINNVDEHQKLINHCISTLSSSESITDYAQFLSTGFHYCDDNDYAKLRFIEDVLKCTLFDTGIYFTETSESTEKNTYKKLLIPMLNTILRSKKNEDQCILLEEGNFGKSEIETIIENLKENQHNFTPRNIEVVIGTKSNRVIAITDYMMNLFWDNRLNWHKKHTERRDYMAVKSHISYVVDYDLKKTYGRRSNTLHPSMLK